MGNVRRCKFSYRLDKLKFLLLLHLLYFENVLQGGVVKELPLLINLRVSLRMSKRKPGVSHKRQGVKAMWAVS